MSLDKNTIEKIATLARLNLDDSQAEELGQDLNNILNLVEQMSSVDTSGITPLAHPLEISARLREDVVSESDQRELFQSIAPSAEEGHYLVPKVIE